jgi:hypothetical protein
MLSEMLIGIHAWAIFALGLLTLFQSKARWTIAAVILSVGVYGLIFLR